LDDERLSIKLREQVLPVFESRHQGIRCETREEVGPLTSVRECADEFRLSAPGRTDDIEPARIAFRPSGRDGRETSIQGNRVLCAEPALVEFHEIAIRTVRLGPLRRT